MTRLTPAQSKLLKDLDEAPGMWAECEPSERRTAESLKTKGLVEIYEGPGWNSHFDCRSTSVQPDYNNRIRDIPWNTHVFVMARPIKGDWKTYDGSTSLRGRQEFRPCMIQGVENGQRLYVIGSQYAYEMGDFEIREVNFQIEEAH